jgi:hypothetical protein
MVGVLDHVHGCAGVVSYCSCEVRSQDEIRSDTVMSMAAIIALEMSSAEVDGRGQRQSSMCLGVG